MGPAGLSSSRSPNLISSVSTSDAIAAANICRSSVTSLTQSVQVSSVQSRSLRERMVAPRQQDCVSGQSISLIASDGMMQGQDDARWMSFGLCKRAFRQVLQVPERWPSPWSWAEKPDYRLLCTESGVALSNITSSTFGTFLGRLETSNTSLRVLFAGELLRAVVACLEFCTSYLV